MWASRGHPLVTLNSVMWHAWARCPCATAEAHRDDIEARDTEAGTLPVGTAAPALRGSQRSNPLAKHTRAGTGT